MTKSEINVCVSLPSILQAEDLVKALQDLDNSASCDAAVRERIAAFPPEVSDVSLLEKIKGMLKIV